MTLTKITIAIVICVWSIPAMASTPIGQLQSEGTFEVIAAGGGTPTKLNQRDYTFFSGDTVLVTRGNAVLNLNRGGGFGFPQGSRLKLLQTETGNFEADLLKGSVLYAFPRGRENFVFRVGNFTVHAQAPEVRSMQVVSEGEGSIGTIEHLADGNIKASVRAGALHIRNGDSVRYQVSAGESVGLLDLPNQTLRTQSEIVDPGASLILIESPESVGTNEEFLIRWQANQPVDGYIAVAKAGAPPGEFETLVSTVEGNELKVQAPGELGEYEIRFVDGPTGEIRRFVPLNVVRGGGAGGWWDSSVAAAAFGGIAAGGAGVYLVTDHQHDDECGCPPPVSP